ncbi:hypothetical protein MYX82_01690 [Acidobacteria bacterium AH-259-D05]|nr:hypothetical protein [Acidobacteria bacterium AH-259-D05]
MQEKKISKNKGVLNWTFSISVICLLSVLFVVIAAVTETGQALPIFARKYETACTTCHVLVPKLNPFGIAFRNNGYRIAQADEKFVKSQDVSLGAPAWKQVWPNAVWPGAIPGLPPIALRFLSDARIRPSHKINFDMDMPHEIGIYVAGSAGESVSFFAEVELEEGEVEISAANLQFDSLFDTTLLNLKLGRIDLRADPFSKDFRRLTSQHYNVSNLQVISGQPKLRNRQAGVEIWGARTGLDDRGGFQYAFGIVNGVPGEPDTNNFKDYYWAASYKFGGLGVAGSVAPPDTLAVTDNYSEYSFLIGGFGYTGKWSEAGGASPFLEDQYDRIGVKFDAYVNKLNLFGAAVIGRDDLIPFDRATNSVNKIDTSAFFVEADYVLTPWIVPLVRFEKTNFSNRRSIVQIIPAVRLAIRANVQLLFEGRLYNKKFKESDVRTGTNELRIRFDYDF